MLVLEILALLIVGFIAWLLFVPIVIVLKTDEGCFQISQPGVFAFIASDGDFDHFRVRMFGIGLPVRRSETKKPATPANNKPAGKTFSTKSLYAWTYLLDGLMSSIRVRRLICTLDFNNAIWNAYLIPVCTLLNNDRVQLSTNYVNRFLIDLEIRLSVYRVAWTFLNFSFKK